MPSVYVIEDDEAVRTELMRLLEREGLTASFCDDFSRAAELAHAAGPDLVLLDLTLPQTDGQLVCRQIRERSSVPVVVLTSRTTEVDEVMAMTLGADDFVPKPYSGRVLMAHIQACLRRANGSASVRACLKRGGVVLDLSRSQVSHAGATTDLTKNEQRILAALMRRAGTIVSRAELMQELWESDAFVDDNTLTVNVNRLRAALARVGVTEWLATHRGQGYSVP